MPFFRDAFGACFSLVIRCLCGSSKQGAAPIVAHNLVLRFTLHMLHSHSYIRHIRHLARVNCSKILQKQKQYDR